MRSHTLTMTIHWLTAFIDHPATSSDSLVRFWQTATGSALSTRRGDRGQFATLVPPSGDPYLRVQETDDGSAGVHIDLHSDSVRTDADRARELGAVVVRDEGSLVVLRSPAGLAFCVVEHHGEAERPAPIEAVSGAPHVVDQVSIDIPHGAFDAECRFWADLTTWPIHGGSVPEFRLLARQADMALRILLQRLGPDDDADRARAHLDVAAGTGGDAIASWHTSLGAQVLQRGRRWITLLDPAGLPYCLTERDPSTGSLP